MDTNSEISALMASIEHRYPVEKWTINGFQVWGIVRNLLQNSLYTEQWPQKHNKRSFLSRFFKMCLYLPSIRHLFKSEAKTVVFCHGNHRMQFENQIKHRFGSYYFPHALVVDFETADTRFALPTGHVDFSFLFLFKRLLWSKQKVEMPDYELFYKKEILEKYPSLAHDLAQKRIEKVFQNISSMGKIIGFFIKKCAKITVVDKARTECMAAIHAAKILGIATEEIQHGVFVKNDFWYTHHTYNATHLSFEVDRFLVYEQSALEAVNETCFLKNAVLSKSVWHAYLSSLPIKKTKKIILVALYLEQPFQETLLKIAPFLTKYAVMVRPHPLQKTPEIPISMTLSTASILTDLSAAWLVLSFSPTVLKDAETLKIPSIYLQPGYFKTSAWTQHIDFDRFEKQLHWAKLLSEQN